MPRIAKKRVINANVFNRLKGFQDILSDKYYKQQGMFEKAQEIAEYYGFKPIEVPSMERVDVFEKGIGGNTDIMEKEIYAFSIKGGTKVALRPEWTAGVVRAYIENGMQSLPQPILLYSYGSVWRHENPQHGRLREFKQFNLEILGTDKSVSDAIIIRTVYDILMEFGLKNIVVDINSIGEKSSRQDYLKELNKFYKKNIEHLCVDCKNRLLDNPLRLLDCKNESCSELNESAPSSLQYLSNTAKKRFKESLQHLEEMNIPYNINNKLVRGLDYYENIVFEFIENVVGEDGKEKRLTICGGGGYDISANLGNKKEIPSVGAGIGFDRLLLLPQVIAPVPKINNTCKIAFVQLGIEAKLKSLNILKMLRENKISVYQSICKDSLKDQLSMAEEMKIPFALIFGQREAMSDSIIIKDIEKQINRTVPLSKLISELEKIIKKTK